MSHCFVSCGRCGTSWHSSQYFCDVFARWVPVFVAGAALWTWSALFCVFCANRIVRAPSSGDKVQIPWQAWRFVRCDENWRGSLAPNIDFEVANLEVHKKTRRKTSSLKLQSVKFGGSLARYVRSDAPTCLVSSLWLSCGLAVSMGEAAKPLRFEGFHAGCHVALRHMRGTLWHSNLFENMSKVVLCGRRNSFASFSQEELQFSWHAQHFGDSTLHSPHPLHITLHALHSTLYTLHFTHYTLHSTLYTPPSTFHTPHLTLHTLHFTLHTLHSLHSTFYTPHFTLYTLHSTLHTPHFTLCTPHFTLHILHSTLYAPHSTHFTLHTLNSILYTPGSTLHAPHLARHHTPPSSIFHSLRCTGMVTGEKCIRIQDCSKKLFHKSVLRDCISMRFDICTINIHVSIRVRGLHFVGIKVRVPRCRLQNIANTCKQSTFLSYSCRIFRPRVNRKPAVLAFALLISVSRWNLLLWVWEAQRDSAAWDSEIALTKILFDPVCATFRFTALRAFCQGGIKPILDGRDTIGQAQFEAEMVFPCVSCRLLVKACLWRSLRCWFSTARCIRFFSSFTHWFHCVSIAFIKCKPRSGTGKTATFAGHSVGEGISISVSWKFMKCTAQAQQKLFRSQVCQKSQLIFFIEFWIHLCLSDPFRMLDKFLSHCSVSLCMYFFCMQCPRWLARCSASTTLSATRRHWSWHLLGSLPIRNLAKIWCKWMRQDATRLNKIMKRKCVKMCQELSIVTMWFKVR